MAHVLEIKAGQIAAVREDLLGQNGLINLLRKEDPTEEGHEALDVIRDFLTRKTYDVGTKSIKGVHHPRIFVGNQKLPKFITGTIGEWAKSHYLEVISPFFDNTEEAVTLKKLIDELDPIETRVLLPKSQDGAALCEKAFYKAVEEHGAKWSELPGGITRWTDKDKESPHRYVHAKVYRLFSPSVREEFILSGSPNLTNAGHSGHKGANFETAILTGGKVRYKPDWWLLPIEGQSPAVFREGESEEPDRGLAFPKVTFRYDWNTKELSYFWEEESQPEAVEVRFGNIRQFSIEDVRFGKWISLGPEYCEIIEERLRSSSFLEVWVAGEGPHQVLVREAGMQKKPSLLYELTSEEILEYWSQLTLEQKDAFLDRKLAAYIDQALSRALQDKELEGAPESMFDRFAGIFHAFSCLQEYIDDAIEQKRIKDAEYRLFGVKHDSLPSLIDKVLTEEGEDRVNRLVRLLCAREVLRQIQREQPKFSDSHRKDFAEVFSTLDGIEQVKEGF